MKFIKLVVIASVISFLAGCTGHVYNNEKNCSYDYFLHPDISISKVIGGCGPVAPHK
ncbi:YhfL family protein [Entomomonas asaccharolytica]|uniref:YhfL family protein n=1 Tax=Entomomonas asaccharolytica TaxID=2785331 RepID=A0A974RZ87_9GAMM|nr:YhfL family protein [Entomomonas asaccharolytica]QQP86794.1 YhfL family protein [Entomomonas asaccharolytica]